LVGCADFCRLVQKGADVTLAISGFGPILIVFAQNEAKILPLNTFELKLPYLLPFSNSSLLNKGHFLPILPKIG